MTQPRKMICPSTEALCMDGRCKIGHCLIAIRDRIEKSEAAANPTPAPAPAPSAPAPPPVPSASATGGDASTVLISATLSAPWKGLAGATLVVGVCGAAGVAYALVVAWRATRQTGYQLVLEDWVWHLFLPMIAYTALFVGAAGLSHDQPWALFLIAAIALLLLFIGIHNAWDTVTYVVALRIEESQPPKPPTRPGPA